MLEMNSPRLQLLVTRIKVIVRTQSMRGLAQSDQISQISTHSVCTEENHITRESKAH